jgi:hypothetical protein
MSASPLTNGSPAVKRRRLSKGKGRQTAPHPDDVIDLTGSDDDLTGSSDGEQARPKKRPGSTAKRAARRKGLSPGLRALVTGYDPRPGR